MNRSYCAERKNDEVPTGQIEPILKKGSSEHCSLNEHLFTHNIQDKQQESRKWET